MIPSIPGLKRDSRESPRVSVDEGSRDTDDATGSVKGDDKAKLKKKDKKDKSRKGTL
jgi:ATP-binding cassette subfamily B (MDR/TAP) protein 6